MKKVMFYAGLAAALLGLLVSCAFIPVGPENSLVLSVNIPKSDGSRSLSGGARFIAPGTSRLSVTLAPQDGSTPITQDFTVPAGGGPMTVTMNSFKVFSGNTVITVSAFDGTGAIISTGSVTMKLTPGRNPISMSLAVASVSDPGVYMDPGVIWGADTLNAGQVRVHRFQLNTDGWPDYSISIGYSPCTLAVYDANFNRIPNVAGTAEKWSLRTESAETEYFYVVVSNTTTENSVSYQIKCENAYYLSGSGGGTGTRVSPALAPATAAAFQFMYNGRPFYSRLIMQGGTFEGGNLTLADSRSIYGGFSADGTWTRNLSAYPTIITDPAVANNGYCIGAGAAVTRNTTLDGLYLKAADYTVPSATWSYIVLKLTGSPIVTNCRIEGPGLNCNINYPYAQTIRGVNIAYGAGPGPILAYNSILGGRVFGTGAAVYSTVINSFVGVSISGFSGSLANAPLLIGNDIIAWIGQDQPGTTTTVLTFTCYGVYASATFSLINNTIDAGHTLTAWTGSNIASETTVFLGGTLDLTLSRNNLIGVSDASATAASQSVLNTTSISSPGFSKFNPNFFYRALPTAYLWTPFSAAAINQISTVAFTIPGAVGPTNAAANLGIFVNPVPVTGYGDRHLSGSAINSTANPATAGATLLTDPDFLLTANIATLDRDYLRWNKDGNPRTTPGSVGAY